MPIVVPISTGTSVGTGVTTYSGLLATVGDWLNRSDLDTKIPDFITLLEARLNRILRVPEMEDVTTLVAATTVALPTDFLEARELYLDTDPRQHLQAVSPSTLRSTYAWTTTGRPSAYAIEDGAIVLGPSPDSAYNMPLTYYKKIPALSSSAETNWLIVSHPDIYLWGTLVMAEAFIWNDPRVPMWKAAWDEALGELMKHGNRKRYGSMPRLTPTIIE
jgi:hypothetical protein